MPGHGGSLLSCPVAYSCWPEYLTATGSTHLARPAPACTPADPECASHLDRTQALARPQRLPTAGTEVHRKLLGWPAAHQVKNKVSGLTSEPAASVAVCLHVHVASHAQGAVESSTRLHCGYQQRCCAADAAAVQAAFTFSSVLMPRTATLLAAKANCSAQTGCHPSFMAILRGHGC